MSSVPPPEVQAAGRVMQAWLDKVEGRVSDADYAKMSPAQKLDYARRFDQSKFPANPYDTRK